MTKAFGFKVILEESIDVILHLLVQLRELFFNEAFKTIGARIRILEIIDFTVREMFFCRTRSSVFGRS
jgi:hypothetical protein